MAIVQTLVDLAAPWQSIYADSAALSAGVTSVHLLALLFSGGLALGADRATLRAFRGDDRRRAAQLDELGSVHRPVLFALALLFGSGVMLAAADLETFLGSPVFWVKMGLVALLLVNGLVMTRLEHGLRGRGPAATSASATSPSAASAPRVAGGTWRWLRVCAWCSLLLWAATTVAGAVLINV